MCHVRDTLRGEAYMYMVLMHEILLVEQVTAVIQYDEAESHPINK